MLRILGSSHFPQFHTSFFPSLFGRVKPSNKVSTPRLGVPALGLGNAPCLRHSVAPSQAHFRAQPPEAGVGRGCLCPPLRGSVWGRGCPCKSAWKVLSPSRNQLSSASVAFTSLHLSTCQAGPQIRMPTGAH